MPKRVGTMTISGGKSAKLMKPSPSSDGSESNCSSPDVVGCSSTVMHHHLHSEPNSSEMIQQQQQNNTLKQEVLSSPPKPISVASHIPTVGVASPSIAHQVDQFYPETNTISSTKRRFNKVKSESNSTSSASQPAYNQPPSLPETLTLLSPASIKAPLLTENTSKIVDSTTTIAIHTINSSDPSPIMIATSTNNTMNTVSEQDPLNTTINIDNVQDFDFITTDPDVKMQFKKSRDYNFIPSFPKVLYTLTWKHKYDLKISSEKPIFQGVPQKLMMSQIKIELVMGRNFSTPSYDHSKVRQRDRTVSEESRKKRPHRKPNESETTTLTSVSKENDHSIVVRFGINRTFCSKRFNYAPFRLRLDFESEQCSFTLFSPIFHTFAKKLTGFTVINVNEILKKNGEALLPVENTDEVCTDLVGVFRPLIAASIPSEGEYPSEASSSGIAVPSKDQEPQALNEDANLLLSLGGLL